MTSSTNPISQIAATMTGIPTAQLAEIVEKLAGSTITEERIVKYAT
jgi:hypothetical protein